ncbi:MAG: penicillin-insensitive murein endopeptidase [Myxococcota bacterium]|nr:penicillin-insensitive murein endopeptidase [Myxococcota bacterium]
MVIYLLIAVIFGGSPEQPGLLHPARIIDWSWQLHPPVSVGRASDGRLLFGQRLNSDGRLYVKAPSHSWFAGPMKATLHAAHRALEANGSPPGRLVVGDMSMRHGGPFSPHRTHQNGCDVDLRYRLLHVPPGDYAFRFVSPGNFDVASNWVYLKALRATGTISRILMDRTHQRRLWRYAQRMDGLSKATLRLIFGHVSGNPHALVQHARGHYNHFHVRFKCTGARQRGKQWHMEHVKGLQAAADRLFGRSYPHVVRRGDTLGAIARRYGAPVHGIKTWNRTKLEDGLRPGMALRLRPASRTLDYP